MNRRLLTLRAHIASFVGKLRGFHQRSALHPETASHYRPSSKTERAGFLGPKPDKLMLGQPHACRWRGGLSELLRGIVDKADFILLANAYPSEKGLYGGEFVRTRVNAYVAAGFSGCVIEVHARNIEFKLESRGRLCIARLPKLDPQEIARALASSSSVILAHSPSAQLQNALGQHLPSKRLAYWFHGFELRDIRRLYYNYSTRELESHRHSFNLINQQRWDAARHSFSLKNVTPVFVSQFLYAMAVRDVGMQPKHHRIIHNFIDTVFYSKCQGLRSSKRAPRILMIRPFTNRNYATDIATKAIQILSARPRFQDLHFTLRGFGKHFDTDTLPLRDLSNVTLENRYSTPTDLRTLFANHDIALFPTRHDTQGVTFGEAMASGLACITHDVAAIPEFADNNCAILVKPDSVEAYAAAIWELAHDRARINELGNAAAYRVTQQCGWPQTVGLEIELIRELIKGTEQRMSGISL